MCVSMLDIDHLVEHMCELWIWNFIQSVGWLHSNAIKTNENKKKKKTDQIL